MVKKLAHRRRDKEPSEGGNPRQRERAPERGGAFFLSRAGGTRGPRAKGLEGPETGGEESQISKGPGFPPQAGGTQQKRNWPGLEAWPPARRLKWTRREQA
jgi:hypothetical protein